VTSERAKRVEIDGTVRLEGRHNGGQDLAQHRGECTPVEEEDAAMLQEFRDFLLRGNVVELAVAFVLGVAFGAVVNSFVDNLVMPVIAMIIGKPDFSALTFTINDAVFRYGAFITDAISFVAIAAAVFFFVVKPVQLLMARGRGPVDEGMPDEERRHQELLVAVRGISR
jgi:large conductance mechanosensitive channel